MFNKVGLAIIIISLFVFTNTTTLEISVVQDVDKWLSVINEELNEFNKLSAELTWNVVAVGNETLNERGALLGASRTSWRNNVCNAVTSMRPLSNRQKRMRYLLCREPKYTQDQARELAQIIDDMSEAYTSSEVCLPKNSKIPNTTGKKCLKVEPDLEKLISNQSLTSEQLQWIWKSWHDTVAPKIKKSYPHFVEVLNEGAISNGYVDIGEVWRDELETPNLEMIVMQLYNEIRPLYTMLHAVVRYKLVEKYGTNIVDPLGPIPIHLLGNMWGQDWSSLSEMLIPKNKNLKLDEHIGHKNWSVKNMVLIAEDMYASLGLPRMTEKFWKYSKFEEKDKNMTMCHGTAANMFNNDDFRILLCATLNMEDFYVIHHEMGHIEYYMAYKNQPAVFQEGANSAFQESIGDTVMTGVMTPQHLHRLGLISDKQLLDKDLDHSLLLQQALAKIPQIPFALLVDLYRWDIFRGKIKPNVYNLAYWELNKQLRGIAPPEPRDERYFDAGAKFHIPDNTPYIRYLLSAFLQVEMFKGMCEITVYGKLNNGRTQIPFPLHRCDIYGSKKAGDKLKNMMSLGASQHWTETLKILTGKNYITAKPLLEYYKPVYKWLQNYITEKNISVGW